MLGCSHTATCPLFPLLNASLQSWRDYYCDTEDGWLDCARYKMAVTGQPVPITLLPNGKEAQLLRQVAEAGGVGGAAARRAPQQAPPPEFTSRPPPAVVPYDRPSPGRPPAPPFPQYHGNHPAHPPLPAPKAPAKRRWWTRLIDWMTEPT